MMIVVFWDILKGLFDFHLFTSPNILIQPSTVTVRYD